MLLGTPPSQAFQEHLLLGLYGFRLVSAASAAGAGRVSHSYESRCCSARACSPNVAHRVLLRSGPSGPRSRSAAARGDPGQPSRRGAQCRTAELRAGTGEEILKSFVRSCAKSGVTRAQIEPPVARFSTRSARPKRRRAGSSRKEIDRVVACHATLRRMHHAIRCAAAEGRLHAPVSAPG